MLIIIAIIIPIDSMVIFNIESSVRAKLIEWNSKSERNKLDDKYYIYLKFIVEILNMSN